MTTKINPVPSTIEAMDLRRAVQAIGPLVDRAIENALILRSDAYGEGSKRVYADEVEKLDAAKKLIDTALAHTAEVRSDACSEPGCVLWKGHQSDHTKDEQRSPRGGVTVRPITGVVTRTRLVPVESPKPAVQCRAVTLYERCVLVEGHGGNHEFRPKQLEGVQIKHVKIESPESGHSVSKAGGIA